MTGGRLALITGGSSGIGKQLAADLLRGGDRVVIVSHQPEKLERAAAELATISPNVTSIRCDVGDSGQVSSMAAEVERRFGTPDILVNNAGFATYRTFEATALEEIERIANVNLLGAFRCARVFLPGMIARRGGTIVNMASIAGRIIITPNAVYGASKHAMVAWSEALRYELARFNVHVCVVCPGRVETPFFDHETFQTRHMGRETRFLVQVEEVSRATLRAIERRQSIVYVPRALGFVTWLSHALPFLMQPLAGRTLRQRIESIYARPGERAGCR